MKKRILFMLLIGVLIIDLTGCGNKVEKIDEATFYEKIEKVIASNNELSDIKINSSDKIVYVGSYPVGFYQVGDKAVVGLISMDAKGYQYEKMMTAAFMTIDKKLDYDEAAELAHDLGISFLTGGDDIVKNGIKYSWKDNGTLKYDGHEFTAWYIYFDK